jgi:hypothetical protein
MTPYTFLDYVPYEHNIALEPTYGFSFNHHRRSPHSALVGASVSHRLVLPSYLVLLLQSALHQSMPYKSEPRAETYCMTASSPSTITNLQHQSMRTQSRDILHDCFKSKHMMLPCCRCLRPQQPLTLCCTGVAAVLTTAVGSILYGTYAQITVRQPNLCGTCMEPVCQITMRQPNLYGTCMKPVWYLCSDHDEAT